MSYLDNLKDYSKKSRYLVTIDGIVSSNVISTTDFLNEVPYAKILVDSGPSFTFRLFISSDISIAHENPLDDQTPKRQWNPIITQIPPVSTDISNSFYGFFPTFSGNIQIARTEGSFSKISQSCVINDRDIVIYHVVGEEIPENTAILFKGLGQNISLNSNTFEIVIKDPSSQFDNKLKHSEGITTFSESVLSGIDESEQQKSPYKVYGRVGGRRAVKIDDTTYGCMVGTSNLDTETGTCGLIFAGLGLESTGIIISTANKDDAEKLAINDTILLTSDVNPSSTFATRITSLVYSNVFFEFRANIDPVVPAGYFTNPEQSGSFTFSRAPVSAAYTVSGGSVNYLLYDQDYDILFNGTDGTTSIGLTSPNEGPIYVNLVGPTKNELLDGSPYGRNFSFEGTTFFGDPTLGTTEKLQFDHTVILDFCKKYIGLSDNELDIERFQDYEPLMNLQTSVDPTLNDYPYLSVPYAFSIPFKSDEVMPSIKDVLNLMAQTSFIQFYFNREGKFTYRYYFDNRSESKKSLDDNEFEFISYRIENSNIYKIIKVNFDQKELRSETSGGFNPFIFLRTNTGVDFTQNKQISESTALYTGVGYDTASSLGISFVSDTMDTHEQKEAVYGIRRGILEIRCDRTHFDLDVGDFVDISSIFLPGFENEDIPRRMLIVSRQIGNDSVTFKLDDFKAVKDSGINVPTVP